MGGELTLFTGPECMFTISTDAKYTQASEAEEAVHKLALDRKALDFIRNVSVAADSVNRAQASRARQTPKPLNPPAKHMTAKKQSPMVNANRTPVNYRPMPNGNGVPRLSDPNGQYGGTTANRFQGYPSAVNQVQQMLPTAAMAPPTFNYAPSYTLPHAATGAMPWSGVSNGMNVTGMNLNGMNPVYGMGGGGGVVNRGNYLNASGFGASGPNGHPFVGNFAQPNGSFVPPLAANMPIGNAGGGGGGIQPVPPQGQHMPMQRNQPVIQPRNGSSSNQRVGDDHVRELSSEFLDALPGVPLFC
jgi:hypothetical protein